MGLLDDLTTMDARKIRSEFDSFESYQEALDHALELFKSFDESTRDYLKEMGGYVPIMDYLDAKFERPYALVPVIDQGFHQLFSLPEGTVKADSTAYRRKIMDRYNHDRQKFRYDGDFATAFSIVWNNRKELGI